MLFECAECYQSRREDNRDWTLLLIGSGVLLVRKVISICGIMALFVSSIACAENTQLLEGDVVTATGLNVPFELFGENRKNVIGGGIRLGEHTFVVKKMSVHSLLGALRTEGKTIEFAVFSSSYSGQTAMGEPWVVAKKKHGCDKPYNSFLSVYTISSAEKKKNVTDVPYAKLVESLSESDDSVLYCFIAKPPAN